MKYFPLLLGATIALASCKKDENDNTPKYNLEGNLTNTTNRPVRQATVTITPLGQTSPTATVTSDAQGHFALNNVVKGKYLVRAERPGYTAEVDTVDVAANGQHNMRVRGAAQVQGVVINSQTGTGLDSALVSLTFRATGTNPDTALNSADFVVRTDEEGRFTMSNVATGDFTYIVRSDNYNTDVVGTITLTSGNNVIDQHTLVQEVPVGALRVVLTWGENPSDLDSHLSGPADATGTSRFHMYYGDKTPVTEVNLDVDDVTSYGPETTTVLTFHNGVYRFSVHNYSEQSENGAQGIAASGAKVRVFNHEGLVAEFTPPAAAAGAGNTWRVFECTGPNAVTAINTYITAAGASDDANFRTKNGKKPAMAAGKF